jgi:putative aminopeptidase FrvX
VAAALLAGSCLAQRLQVQLLVQPEVQARLESGAVGRSDRQSTIRKLFEKTGCTPVDQRVDKHNGNVICILPGQIPSTIVVGGHFDFADRGQGIVDDWSGASLLPSLYEALKNQPRQHTFAFVAFANEELGLLGSIRYVKQMNEEQRSNVRAFVNLECLGLTPTKVWLPRSTPELVTRLRETASAIGMSIQGVSLDRVGDDDTHPFVAAHIPVISIHSVTQETWKILHSPFDRLDAIRLGDYYDSYRLVAYYLAYLDVKLARLPAR